MAVEHTCFFHLAQAALEKNGEAWTRSAISRAYYGMYHSAMRVTGNRIPAKTLSGESLPGGVHQRLYTFLCSGEAAQVSGYDAASMQEIGLKLKQYHEQRIKADYRLYEKLNRITAVTALREAEKVDEMVNQLLTPRR